MPAKRTFADLRKSILECLRDGRKTVNDISTKTGINWKTVDNHLIYLCGKGLVHKVFDSPYVKIFELAREMPKPRRTK
ncbi:ArsR family transcriptional regulator [Candidatus Woesearchaeota archaeon]|nr:ArsR family transcriptional regulator [Candidatus Woesearchaeota archaeon]